MASQISNNDRHKLAQVGASRKRKERDRRDHADAKAEPAAIPAQAQPACAGGNMLLAGYLAHEFLTKGSLFGKRWGHAGPAAARPLAPASPQPEAKEPIQQPTKPGKSPVAAYAEVAELLKTEGAHVPGVVNPTQLARWLQL